MTTLIPSIGGCVARMTGVNTTQIMTMKVSKGLEFTVSLVDLEIVSDHDNKIVPLVCRNTPCAPL